MFSYQIEDGTLIITETGTGKIIWQGKPFLTKVSKVIPYSLKECLILLDYYDFGRTDYSYKGNLFLMNINGEIIWHAELPSTGDIYVYFNYKDNKITANSNGGFHVQIDPKTGKIIYLKFTK